MHWTTKSNQSANRVWNGRHRAEHWYRDNQIYFITARCRSQFPAFAGECAKGIFWDRFERACAANDFHPWVTSLLDNHYHTVGWLERGESLPRMMKSFHGAVAKLVNDALHAQFTSGGLKSPCLDDRGRLVPFWSDAKGKSYFDGCLRDSQQGARTYEYVLRQSVRHGVTSDWRAYPHTRIVVPKRDAIQRAIKRSAFLDGVPYKRYQQP